MSTKKCAVRGVVVNPTGRYPGEICGHVRVGPEKLCGFKGKCEHQLQHAPQTPKTEQS